MALALKTFYNDLYTEHLEEASFLYEQRIAWLHDIEVSWFDISELEQRLEAHIDALVVGGSKAKAVCVEKIQSGDFGELYAITCVFCRTLDNQSFSTLWKELDYDDDEKEKAVSDALLHESPSSWIAHFNVVLESEHTQLYSLLVPTVATNTSLSSKAIINLLNSSNPITLASFIYYIGISGASNYAHYLFPFLNATEQMTRQYAAIALLKLGKSSILDQLASEPEVFALPIALSGSKEYFPLLSSLAHKENICRELCTALGICGDINFAPILIDYLDHPDYSSEAAQSLQLLSGANLYDDIFVSDVFTEEDLFEEELEDYSNGKNPVRPDGEAFGDEKKQLSTDKQTWRHWFQKNKDLFTNEQRYRYGKVHNIESMQMSLLDTRPPYRIRQLIGEELAIQQTAFCRFSVNSRVNTQLALLKATPS